MILQKREEKKNEIEKAVGRETRHINEQKNIRKTHQYDIRTGIKRKEEKRPNEKSKRESEGEWLEVKVNEEKKHQKDSSYDVRAGNRRKRSRNGETEIKRGGKKER